MPGVAMTDTEHASASADGNVAAAQILMERMQESGARERIKEWLVAALENDGWTAAMDLRAAELVAKREEEGSSNEANGMPAPPSVAEVAQQLFDTGFETIPEAVREELLKELVATVRSISASAATQAE